MSFHCFYYYIYIHCEIGIGPKRKRLRYIPSIVIPEVAQEKIPVITERLKVHTQLKIVLLGSLEEGGGGGGGISIRGYLKG